MCSSASHNTNKRVKGRKLYWKGLNTINYEAIVNVNSLFNNIHIHSISGMLLTLYPLNFFFSFLGSYSLLTHNSEAHM